MQVTVFRLKPLGAFHFSSQSTTLDAVNRIFGSDQLYSALFVENLQSQIFTDWTPDHYNPPFRISSSLPYIGTMPLFPAPMLPPSRHEAETNAADRKKIKKIAFLSPTVLQKRLNGEPILHYLQDPQKGVPALWQGGAVVVDPDEAKLKEDTKRNPAIRALMGGTIWSEISTPHVTVDRATNQPVYFAVKELRFAADCGMAVLAHGDPEALARLRHLLELLGESGIGGRRSKGLGQFHVEADAEVIDLPDPNTPRLMCLSRYIPSAMELEAGVLGEDSSYQLMDVGGWISSSANVAQRRKTITLLREGAVLSQIDTALNGAIHDLRPTYENQHYNHPVWRFGLALPIGIPWRNA